MDFYDYASLQQAIYAELKLVAEDISKELVEMLKEQIDKDVYDIGTPSVYERIKDDYSFREAWDSITKAVKNGAESDIFYTPETMDWQPYEFIHGSIYWKTDDVRPYLASIIFDGLSGELFAPGQPTFWKNPRPAWYHWLQELSKGKFTLIARKHLTRHGFELKA